MRALFVVGVVLWWGCGPAPAPREAASYACTTSAAVTLSGPQVSALEGVMDEAARHFPGVVAYAVTPAGTWFSTRGVADLETQAPMQPCTRMRAGSVSKTFVALATLRLVDRGVLDLDAPAASYVAPSVVKDLANADRATLRQLLNHTSGLPHGLDSPGIALSFLFNDPTRPRSTLDYLNNVRGLPAAFPVGQGWGYSNSNYNLLGVVLESVTGHPLSEVLHDEVFAPLGVASSWYLEPPTDAPTPARGYLDYQGTGTLVDSTDFTMGLATPAGGVVSTVFDLATVVGAAAREPRMQAWVDVPAAKAVAPGHTGYGLGLMRWHTPYGDALGHGGELFGWQAWAFTFAPQQVTWVMLVNADFGQASSAFHHVQGLAAQALLE